MLTILNPFDTYRNAIWFLSRNSVVLCSQPVEVWTKPYTSGVAVDAEPCNTNKSFPLNQIWLQFFRSGTVVWILRLCLRYVALCADVMVSMPSTFRSKNAHRPVLISSSTALSLTFLHSFSRSRVLFDTIVMRLIWFLLLSTAMALDMDLDDPGKASSHIVPLTASVWGLTRIMRQNSDIDETKKQIQSNLPPKRSRKICSRTTRVMSLEIIPETCLIHITGGKRVQCSLPSSSTGT